MRRARLLLAGWLTALIVGAILPAGSALATDGPAVVLIGAPGLMWTDIDAQRTPALAGLLAEGAGAVLTVRAVRARACAADGWLTLSAGQRAADLTPTCRTLTGDDAAREVPAWQDYRRAAAAASYGAQPGALGDAFAAAGGCLSVQGPGALIAAADETGRPVTAGSGPCRTGIVDAGVLPAGGEERVQALARLDTLVAAHRTAERNLLVVGIGDGASPMAPRALIAAGPAFGRGLLTSASTRQPGIVQLPDVTATLQQLNGLSVAAAGRPVTVSSSDLPAAQRASDLAGMQVRSTTMRALAPQVTGAATLAFAGWALLAWAMRSRRGRGGARAGTLLGLWAAGLPCAAVAVNLWPWWRSGAPEVAAAASMVLLASALALAADAVGGRHRRQALAAGVVIWGATAGLLLLDVLTGSRLQTASAFGYNPIVGGRYYGFGNSTFAPFAVSVLGLMAVASTWRGRGRAREDAGSAGGGLAPVAPVPAAVLLVAAVGIGAAGPFGADFGGPPALLIGGILLLAMLAGVRVSPLRVLLVSAGAAAAAVLVLYLDWRRPAGSRTHLGNFFQDVLDGQAVDVLTRKLSQNLANLLEPRLLLMTGAGVLGWWLLSRYCRHLPVRRLVLAAAVTLVAGFAINDSGLAIPAFGALTLIPAVSAHRDPVPR